MDGERQEEDDEDGEEDSGGDGGDHRPKGVTERRRDQGIGAKAPAGAARRASRA
jgi:hypothetical protein